MNPHTHSRAQHQLAANRRSPLALLTIFLTLIAVLSLAGCTGLTGAGTPAGNSNPASSGALAASATSFTFGGVKIGTKTLQTLTLTNTETTTVTISQGSVTGSAFTIVGGMSSISIPAGQNKSFQIQFLPTSTGTITGSVAVASDASDSALAISMSGVGMSTLAISTQPANQSVVAGQTANFSIAGTGSGTLTYQWQKNAAAIGGATSSSYTTPATTTSDNGAQFSVVVTDTNGSLTSNSATLTVSSAPVAPSISAQPASRSVTAGQTATFSVTATGTATLTYQWKKNGTAISGATSSSYTTPTTTASDNGALFSVTVTNNTGNVTSANATLTVNVPPSISTQPANKSVNAGQTAAFTVAATGTGTLTYQWQKNGAAISGATSSSYTTRATAVSDNGALFSVTVTGASGSVTSSAATLTVTGPPTISAQPANQSAVAGSTATFGVTAASTLAMTYQWQKNGVAITGAATATYTTPATASADNGSTFRVVVTNAAGSVTSNSATLTVTAAPVAPSITAQPANQAVTAGQTATFSVTASGTGTLTYQWKKNGTAISGATSASYTTPATAAADNGALFTVTVTNTTGNVTSNSATLTVNVPPSISAQPANKTVTAGQTATFSVTATGTGTLTYQWKKNGTAVSGATSASYTTPATVTGDNGALFTVTVTGAAGNVTSSAATLTVNAAPVAPSITTQPASKTVIAGQTATFSVTAAGTATLTYQWNKNGTAIGGATSASYTTPATAVSDNGAAFTVTVTNSVGNITSSAGTLTVTAATLVLNASQTSLNFSSVNIGSSTILPVTFTNAGNSNVTISSVSIVGAGFTASGVSSGQIVTPGSVATLNVKFAPSASGAVSGASATITSNATNSPAAITLLGTGIQPVSHSVTLNWVASASAVAGYNVYRSTVSGGPYTKVNAALVTTTSYTDSTVQSGQTYFYVVTSVTSGGVESADSTEVSAVIP